MVRRTGQKVTTMQPDPQPDDTRAADELLHPSYWLVHGLPWQGDGDLAEAAVAIAPGMIARESLSRDAFQILGCADLYARKHGSRVIFFSDLTRMFTAAGTSWAATRHRLGRRAPRAAGRPVPGAVPDDLRAGPHLHLRPRDTAAPRRAGRRRGSDRRRARSSSARPSPAKLAADWPPYMQQMIDTGRIRLAG